MPWRSSRQQQPRTPAKSPLNWLRATTQAAKGSFASGRSNELLDDKVITKAFTGCKDSSGTHTYRYFILNANSDFIVYALTGERVFLQHQTAIPRPVMLGFRQPP